MKNEKEGIASKFLVKWRMFWILIIFIMIYVSWDYVLLIRASYLIEGCATKEEFEKISDPKLENNQRVSLNKKIADCILSKQSFIESFFMKIPIDLESK